MKLKDVFFVLILFHVGQAAAQLTNTDMNMILKTTGSRLDLGRYEEINGTPYLFEGWKNGTINLNNQSLTAINDIRFNCYQNQLEYLLEGQVYTPLNRYNEFSISLLNGRNEIVYQIFRNGFLDVAEARTYFEVLYDGKTKLLQKHFVRVDEYAEPLSYRRLRKFTKVTSLYVYKTSEKKLFKIKNEKKSILEVIADKKSLIQNYIVEYNLKLKNEEEIIDVLKYYDRN